MGPWNLITLAEARRLAIEEMSALPPKTEQVGLRQALGRVAAADIVSTEDNPPFDRSTVDGYAVRSADSQAASTSKPVSIRLVGEVRMGKPGVVEIAAGEAVRIPTGGMVPAGADAVVMQEYSRGAGAGLIEITCPAAKGENVIARGDDLVAGTVIVSAGCRIGVPDLGVLASCGVARLLVAKKPVVTVITTGDEIVSPEVVPLPGQIRDVNSFTLSALAETAGCDVVQAGRVPDCLDGLTAVLQTALVKSDLILISGGSSVGDRDYTTTAVRALPGVRLLFHGVALKPGKPTLLAMVGGTAVFGIPGNTVAAMTVFHEIVEPALAARQGMAASDSRFVIQARLGSCLRPDSDRDEIFRVQLEQTAEGVVAWPLPAKSGLITVMTRAHGMVYAQAGQPERQPGELVEVQVLMDRVSGKWRGAAR